MIIGLGTDIVDIARLERAVERSGERFTSKVYTENELAYAAKYKMQAERLAGRWAAKEAASKALGTGIFGALRFKDIEIISAENGKPELLFHGAAEERAAELGIKNAHITISHTTHHAVAFVVLEGE